MFAIARRTFPPPRRTTGEDGDNSANDDGVLKKAAASSAPPPMLPPAAPLPLALKLLTLAYGCRYQGHRRRACPPPPLLHDSRLPSLRFRRQLQKPCSPSGPASPPLQAEPVVFENGAQAGSSIWPIKQHLRLYPAMNG